jgi:hypothetical protein
VKKFAVMGLAVLLIGCRTQPVHVNLRIPPPCLTKDVELINCDLSSPPKCRKIIVAYKSECAVVNLPR